MTMEIDVGAQTHQCFKTISKVLIEAGSSLADVIRVNYVVTDTSYAGVVLEIVGGYFGDIRPAAMIIVAGLLNAEMKVEIEVTALKR